MFILYNYRLCQLFLLFLCLLNFFYYQLYVLCFFFNPSGLFLFLFLIYFCILFNFIKIFKKSFYYIPYLSYGGEEVAWVNNVYFKVVKIRVWTKSGSDNY